MNQNNPVDLNTSKNQINQINPIEKIKQAEKIELTEQTKMPLVEALQTIADRPHTRFYLPGHKGGRSAPTALENAWGSAIFRADLPELPDFDNLFAPTAAILAAQQLAAAAFGAEQTWFLCNGSTAGVIAAIVATCNPGDRLLLPRNVHRSAIAGLIQSGAMPIWLNPPYDPHWDLALGLSAAAIQAAIAEYPDLKAIFLVSPTYHGICSEVAEITAIAHQHNIPVIVDAAHGSHLGFHPQLPPAALPSGADVVIHSTHKTLSALSQAAMLHAQGDRVDHDRLTQALSLVQSTSPNALLLASLDAARHQIIHEGRSRLDHLLQLTQALTLGLARLGLPTLATSQPQLTIDPTRLTVRIADWGISGYVADEWLYARQLAVELPSNRCLTLALTLGNTEADIEQAIATFEQLAYAAQPAEISTATPQTAPNTADQAAELIPLTHTLNSSHPPSLQNPLDLPNSLSIPDRTPRTAFFQPSELIALETAAGRIAAATLCPYPPGIPLVFPGEQLTSTTIATLQGILQAGGTVTGLEAGRSVRVVRCEQGGR